MKVLGFAVLFCCLAGFSQNTKQTARSVPSGYSFKGGKLYLSIPLSDTKQQHLEGFLAKPLFADNVNSNCTNLPTMEDATATDDNFYSMSVNDAASLKIQVPIVSAGVNGTKMSDIFMRQYKRYATCTAPDGTILEYGQAMRAVVRYDNTQVQGNASFPLVVANATISNQTTQIDIQNTGFIDNSVSTARAEAIASLTSGALTIDNYGTFMSKLNTAMSAADTTTNAITAGKRTGVEPKVTLIGREIAIDGTQLPDSLAQAFAINYIAGGYGCMQAQDDYSKTDLHSRSVIQETYQSLTKNCGAPTPIDKLTASTMLHGMTITKPKGS